RVYVGDSRGIVYSLKTDYGQQTWQRMVGAPVTGKLAVVESKLLVFTNKPNVVCLEAGEGRQELWQYAGAKELLAVGKEVVYLLTDDHSVAAVSIETGEERWRDPLPPDCKVVGDPRRPVLYLANSGGSIVALAELD
ncbi:MAG: outer membrane protein assembly factor BamB family protein, partial [Planctomycetota bacterium]